MRVELAPAGVAHRVVSVVRPLVEAHPLLGVLERQGELARSIGLHDPVLLAVGEEGRRRDLADVQGALRAALAGLRAELNPWAEPAHVFPSPTGKRWDERNFARAFDRLCKKAPETKAVRPLHFHCARHAFASWALEGGRSVKWIQKQLGHLSAALTLRTHTDLMPTGGDELDFLSDVGPDRDLTRPDQEIHKKASTGSARQRSRSIKSGTLGGFDALRLASCARSPPTRRFEA